MMIALAKYEDGNCHFPDPINKDPGSTMFTVLYRLSQAADLSSLSASVPLINQLFNIKKDLYCIICLIVRFF